MNENALLEITGSPDKYAAIAGANRKRVRKLATATPVPQPTSRMERFWQRQAAAVNAIAGQDQRGINPQPQRGVKTAPPVVPAPVAENVETETEFGRLLRRALGN